MSEERHTIDKLPREAPFDQWAAQIADGGKRRFLSYGMDFDTRAIILAEQIQPNWDDEVKASWIRNQALIRTEILREFGERDHETKIANFISVQTAPFSIMSYHNALFHQVRRAFIVGYYYPALVSACALGERILNHLILDLREYFRSSPEYRHVRRKDSFDNWEKMVGILLNWDVLLPQVAEHFRRLAILRHRSVHFNPDTYVNLRDDALKAILHLRSIIEEQFGSFSAAPWFIKGTAGHCFVAKVWESKPFVRAFVLPTCQLMGPLFAIKFDANHRPVFYDHADYGDGVWSDEEFSEHYNKRNPEDIVKPPDEM